MSRTHKKVKRYTPQEEAKLVKDLWGLSLWTLTFYLSLIALVAGIITVSAGGWWDNWYAGLVVAAFTATSASFWYKLRRFKFFLEEVHPGWKEYRKAHLGLNSNKANNKKRGVK